jgi:hypothetical protein
MVKALLVAITVVTAVFFITYGGAVPVAKFIISALAIPATWRN